MAMIENEMEKKVYKVEDVQNLLGLGPVSYTHLRAHET